MFVLNILTQRLQECILQFIQFHIYRKFDSTAFKIYSTKFIVAMRLVCLSVVWSAGRWSSCPEWSASSAALLGCRRRRAVQTLAPWSLRPRWTWGCWPGRCSRADRSWRRPAWTVAAEAGHPPAGCSQGCSNQNSGTRPCLLLESRQQTGAISRGSPRFPASTSIA